MNSGIRESPGWYVFEIDFVALRFSPFLSLGCYTLTHLVGDKGFGSSFLRLALHSRQGKKILLTKSLLQPDLCICSL